MKKNLLFFGILYIIIAGCANIVPPSGGAKDTTPPALLKTTPKNGRINFIDKGFELFFDEFIVLKDINKQLIISPPFETKPDIAVHGKRLKVNFKDTLLKNTTYIFNFGNAIVDFNEGNIFKNFLYTFSTGSYIDSMQISGFVVNAFSLKPEEKESVVLLYDNFSDSVPRKVIPHYVTRTDNSGFFHFNFLKPQSYYIVALNEINDNYLFDLPSEKIAFLDSVIIPDYRSISDTMSDSLIVNKSIYSPDSLKLFLFTEKQNTQYIADYKRLTPYHCQVVFFAPNLSLPEIHLLESDSFQVESSEKIDTIQLWLPNDTNLFLKDTLTFVFGYDFLSDSGNVSVKDTLFFKFKKPYQSKPLTLSAINKFPMPDNQQVIIKFSEPISVIDTNKVIFTCKTESTIDTLHFIYRKMDSIGKQLIIDNRWQYGKSYNISFDSAAVTSVYHHCNDSIGINISIQDPDYYGKMSFKIKTKKENAIFQLLDANDMFLREISVFPDDSILVFKQLNPGSFKLKVFFDNNNNSKWDTGNLKDRQQPETVSFYPQPIVVKSGWEMTYEWEIK